MHLFQKGQSLIELILAVGLLGILLPALSLGVLSSREGKAQQNQRIQAVAMMREADEAVRNIRDNGWTSFASTANAGPYHPVISANTWTLASGSGTVNGFTTQVVVSDVSRDGAGAIVASGGSDDPSTKKVVTTISWTTPFVSNISQTNYLTRHESISYTDTTLAQFDAGVKTNTFTTNTAGGEVTLGAGGGGGDWCIPSKSVTQVDLPRNGVANAVSAIEGTVFAATGDNASGPSFQKIGLTTDRDPPVATPGAMVNDYKTNAVFGEQNFAYIGTDTNAKEFVIISLTQYSNPPTNTLYQTVGSINLPNQQNGVGIYVLNNKAYALGSDNKLYIYDITNRAKDYSETEMLNYTGNKNTSGFTLSGTGKKITVSVDSASGKTYAYIITGATTNQLQIVDVSNPATVLDANAATIRSQLTLGSAQTGVDLVMNITGSVGYAVTSYTAGRRNFFIINTQTKSSPTEIVPTNSGYNTNGMNPKGLAVVTGNRVIIVGTGGSEQYQVVKLDTTTTPTHCAGLTYATGVNGVASVLQQSNGFAYSYIITGDAGAELKVILGGAGGQYVSSGTFESAPYNPGFATAYNAFKATISNPGNTTVKLKVAVAQAVGGVCTGVTYSYVGPNGDPSQYFLVGSDPSTIEGIIPLLSSGSYKNPGQCFRYKYSFDTTDSTATPVLYDMTVNYSP